jgi:3-oxoacyl-[acyl-carrier protein] reductase
MMFANRLVLVTGASRGIGAATAKLFAKHQATVAVSYLNSEAAARKVVEDIVQAGGKAEAFKADSRDEAQVNAMVTEITAKLGPIDTLVTNASIGFPVVPFTDYKWSDFEAKLVGELKATFFCCKAVVPGMIARKAGCIIAISSNLSRQPGPGFCAHSTAKSGLDAFVKSLALELGQFGIRANVVAPGLTITDATSWIPQLQKDHMAGMVPMRRLGRPEDVAGAVLALASDACGFVTGTYVPVSGGSLMP